MNAKRQLVLGVFFVVALSILAFYTLFLTDFSLFKEPIKMTADFHNANALRAGDPVLVAGKRIGRVKAIVYRPEAERDRRIRVEMHLDDAVELNEGYEIAIEDSTFLGGHNVAIDPGPYGGTPAAPDEEGVYRGIVRPSPLAALNVVGDLVANSSEDVRGILRNLNEAIAAVRTGDGVANKLLYDEKLANDLTAAVGDIRAASADLRTTVGEAREIIASLKAGEGTLGKLLADDQLYADTLATVEGLKTVAEDIQAGKGVVGALLQDEALANELRKVVADVSSVTDGLANGEGLLGRLLKDPELADAAKEMIANFAGAGADLRELATTLRGTDGTLGKLLNDPELYDEALTALKILTRSLEDYRESAPVSAFTSAIFSGI